MVLKICETKNNVWKKYELSIQNGIDNCTEIIKIKPDFARWNNDFNFIGVGDGIWIPLSAPFLENGADNGLAYEEVLNDLLRFEM